MPRHLTKRQKNILDKVDNDIYDVNDMDTATWNVLENINDYETLWQDVNRYLWDKAMGARFGG